MKRRNWWIPGGIVLFVLCVLVRFPASLVAHALPSDIRLAGVEGSIWNGSAMALGLKDVVAQEKLRWHFEPSQLLRRGALAWRIEGEHDGVPGGMRVVLGVRERDRGLEQVRLSLPIDPLSRFYPKLAGMRLRGTIQVDTPRLVRGEPASGQIRLERVTSAMTAEPVLLGSYRADIAVNVAGTGTLRVASLSGPLQIEGDGSFSLTGKDLRIKLTLKPETELPGLSSALATLPREQDRYLLDYSRS